MMGSIILKKTSIVFHPRNLVVLAAAVVLFILRWKYKIGFISFIIFFILPLAFYFIVLPIIARKRFPLFERNMRKLQMEGKFAESLQFYMKNLFLRGFGPVNKMKKLLGQTYILMGNWSAGRQALYEALMADPSGVDIGAACAYADCCFHDGCDVEALKALVRIDFGKVYLPLSAFQYIHLTLKAGMSIDKVKELFNKIQWRDSTEEDKALKLLSNVEILIADGRVDAARQILERIDRNHLPEPMKFMKRFLDGKTLLLSGKKAEAEKIFKELTKTSYAGRHQIEAEEEIKRLK